MVHDASVSTSTEENRVGGSPTPASENAADPRIEAAAEGQAGAVQEFSGGLEYAEAVLAIAALIPPGKVLSYGDVAELLGSGGPRQVGAAMAASGDSVCWWRVIRADGTLRADLKATALLQWDAEDTVLRHGKVLMRQARWQPDEEAHGRIDAISASLPIAALAKRRHPLI